MVIILQTLGKTGSAKRVFWHIIEEQHAVVSLLFIGVGLFLSPLRMWFASKASGFMFGLVPAVVYLEGVAAYVGSP